MEISAMKEIITTTSSTNTELGEIIDLLKGFHEDINEKITIHQEAVNAIKGNIQSYLNKIKNNESYDEEALSALVSNSTQLSSIITLTQRIDDKMNVIDQLKEALIIEDIAEEVDDCLQINLKMEKKRDEEEEMNYINDEDSIIRSRTNEKPISNFIGNKRKHKADEDDESFTLSKRNKNGSNEVEDKQKTKLFRSTRPVPFICQRKRRPLIFCDNNVRMDKYAILYTNPLLCNYKLSEESSDFNPSTITLNAEDKIEELKTERQALFPIVLNDIKPYATRYLYDNFNQLLHIRTIYFCCYDMRKTPPEYNYEYLSANTEIVNGMKDFKFIKLVLIRIQGGKIQNVILGCSNLFSSYIIRKDIEGHTMIKGELKVSYETFHFYFLTGIKGFSQLSQIQIEVYVHKYELYDDYNETIDKTNLKSDIIKKYHAQGSKLKRLRIIDKKLKLTPL